MAYSGRDTQGWIYLIHLEKPVGNERHSAQHYLGWASDVEKRLAQHRSNIKPAAILRAANQRGISYRVVATWPGTYADEQAEKKRCRLARFCPECAPAFLQRRRRYDRERYRRRKERQYAAAF